MRNRLASSILSFCAVAALASSVVAEPEPRSTTPSATPSPRARAADKPVLAKAAPGEAAPAQDDARRAEVVARYEGGEVTVGELEDAIAAQNPAVRARYADKAAIKELLDKTVRFDLLAAEAARRGFDKDQAVILAQKQNAVQAMLKRELDDKITAQSIPEADVKKYFDEHPTEFSRPETRRASQLVVATREEAESLAVEAKRADMRAFRELVRQKSVDEATKLRGGDLRYFDEQGKLVDEGGQNIEAEAAKAVFKLANVGDVTKPVQVPGGFALIKLTGLRKAYADTFEKAEERIRMRLWREQRQAAIDAMLAKLKDELKPEVHPELLDAIRFDEVAVPPTQGLPPGFPQAKPTKK